MSVQSMKKSIILILCVCALVLGGGCAKTDDSSGSAAATVPEPASQSETEKLLGAWVIVGEGDYSGKNESRIEDYYSQTGEWTWTFYDDGTYELYAPQEAYCRDYVLTADGFIHSYDASGKRVDPDYRIRYEGENVILEEYWHIYDAESELRDFEGSYDEADDHDFYILRRKK